MTVVVGRIIKIRADFYSVCGTYLATILKNAPPETGSAFFLSQGINLSKVGASNLTGGKKVVW